ncbi:MAG: alanine racemase [Candidatus Dormibacteria bacterium]
MLRLCDLLEAAGAQGPVVLASGPEVFSAIAHDSRNVEPGELFVAIRTAHGDGHTHLLEARSRGATGLLVERWPDDLWEWQEPRAALAGVTVVLVRDTRAALLAWAGWRLRETTTVMVGGSLGKSTAQEALRRTWEAASRAPVASVGDRNDTLGIPVAVGRFQPTVRQAVLEVVAAGAAERRQLREMVEPRVLCLTTTEDAEQLYWSSRADLAESVASLMGQDSIAVLPVAELGILSCLSGRPQITFGALGSGADLELGPDPQAAPVSWPGRWRCLVVARGQAWQVECPLHPVVAAASWAPALAGVLALGLELPAAVAALAECRPLPGRLRTWAGREGGVVLDDTIDATPASMELALSALAGLPQPRLACLGQGTRVLLGAGAEGIVAQADIAVVIPEELENSLGQVSMPASVQRSSLVEVVARARAVLRSGGSVLVKGPALQRMERVTRALVGPAAELVRQDRGRRLMTFRSASRPTWVEVDLEALATNVAEVCAELGGIALMAVVKADAYGHGAVQVARAALACGAAWVAAATVAEAAELRQRGIGAPLLVLGYTPPDLVERAYQLDLVLTVFDQEVLEALDRAGERLGGRAKAHLKVDTGMSRLGIAPEQVPEFVGAALGLPHLDLEGIYTHFRKGQDESAVAAQMERFDLALRLAAGAGHSFRIRHAANSAAWKHAVAARLDMVRVGGELLGLETADGRRRRPVLSFKTTVAQLRRIPAGTHVGYGDSFQASSDMTVATLPVGYGDGFRRVPGNFGSVLIRGRQHRLVGDVSMDMCMVDVSSDPAVSRGDQVVLIGCQGSEVITAEEVARRLGTVNYEVVTQILPRVPREAIVGDALLS